MNVPEAAKGRWRDILPALGIPIEFLNGRHQPCPVCGGKDRARFDDKDGRGGYYCNGCGAGDGFDLLQKLNGWDFKTAADEVKRLLPDTVEFRTPPRRDPTVRLRKIAQGLHPIGKEVVLYLNGRGLAGRGWRRIKQHDGLEYFDDGKVVAKYPAMVAVVTDVNDEPVTLHVTYIENGQKAPVTPPRKVMPSERKLNGCAVRLGMGEEIAVTEGIETAMAVETITGLPTWAAISENGMRRLEVPESVKAVRIYADNDANFVGQSAAHDLAKRMYQQGKRVSVEIPTKAGTDFLDVLMEATK